MTRKILRQALLLLPLVLPTEAGAVEGDRQVFEAKELMVMLNKWDGCCVGLPPTPFDSIEAALDTIEDMIEPYLIQQGFIQRTPRGRIATLAAYRHLGVAARNTGDTLFEE